MKKATSYRLTKEAIQLIEALALQLGIAQTNVIELAVREMAKRAKVQPKNDKT